MDLCIIQGVHNMQEMRKLHSLSGPLIIQLCYAMKYDLFHNYDYNIEFLSVFQFNSVQYVTYSYFDIKHVNLKANLS